MPLPSTSLLPPFIPDDPAPQPGSIRANAFPKTIVQARVVKV